MYDRSKSIGASDAVHIWAGEWAMLFDRKTSSDAPSYPLPAAIGHALEDLNRELFMEDTGRDILVRDDWQQNPLRHHKNEWCAYLPDGLLQPAEDDGELAESDEFFIPFEAKAVNMMWKPHNLLDKYRPQLMHAMRVTGAPYAIFSVIYLNTKYEWTKVAYDEPFDLELQEQEELFLFMLERGIRPPEYQGKRKGWTA